MEYERFLNMIKFEDIKIGQKFIKKSTGLVSIVTNKTTNSIEMFIQADVKSADGKFVGGETKGISYTNWYSFDRRFFELFDEIVLVK